MSCIHFKFKSSLDYEKLTFDGLHISLSDLKEAIMKQKKIGSVNQYTLSVKDAQSKKGEKNELLWLLVKMWGILLFWGVGGGGGGSSTNNFGKVESCSLEVSMMYSVDI